jgi:hypothetical protein
MEVRVLCVSGRCVADLPRCDHVMGHNVTQRKAHTRNCGSAPVEVRRACGYEGAADAAAAAAPAEIEDVVEIVTQPAHLGSPPRMTLYAVPKRARTQPITALLPVRPRQYYTPPTEADILTAMTEAMAEAGWAFEAFALPCVRKLLRVASGNCLADSDIPTPYKVRQHLVGLSESYMTQRVTRKAEIAPDYSASASFDGWQSRRGVELITSGIAGLPGQQHTTDFIGLTAIRGKVSHNRVEKAHKAAIASVVGTAKVGLYVHDCGSNVKKAAESIVKEAQAKGQPVFEVACGLHVLHNLTSDVVKKTAVKEVSAFTARVAAAVARQRRTRDEFHELVQGRRRVVNAGTPTEQEVPDCGQPAVIAKTKCLCLSDNLAQVARLQDVWKRIIVMNDVGATFKKKVLGKAPPMSLEYFLSNECWERAEKCAELLAPCGRAIRVMQRSCTRLHDCVPIFQKLEERMLVASENAYASGVITAADKDTIKEVMAIRLAVPPLMLVAYALVPGNAEKLAQPQRLEVSNWLHSHAHLYGAEPGRLADEYIAYTLKDPVSVYAQGGDVWTSAPNPTRFWMRVRFQAETSTLARVATQLIGFHAHAGDLERVHSTMGWLHNRYCALDYTPLPLAPAQKRTRSHRTETPAGDCRGKEWVTAGVSESMPVRRQAVGRTREGREDEAHDRSSPAGSQNLLCGGFHF